MVEARQMMTIKEYGEDKEVFEAVFKQLKVRWNKTSR